MLKTNTFCQMEDTFGYRFCLSLKPGKKGVKPGKKTVKF